MLLFGAVYLIEVSLDIQCASRTIQKSELGRCDGRFLLSFRFPFKVFFVCTLLGISVINGATFYRLYFTTIAVKFQSKLDYGQSVCGSKIKQNLSAPIYSVGNFLFIVVTLLKMEMHDENLLWIYVSTHTILLLPLKLK